MPEEKRYLTVKPPSQAGGEDFYISEVVGEEQISELFQYRLQIRSSNNKIDFSKIIGNNMAVSIAQSNGEIKYINGVVTRFQQGDNDGNYSTYFAEIRPWLWQLSLTTDSRIFQEQTAMEIIEAVFSDFGFSDYSDKTKGTFTARKYCVQYQETALDFVTRLMEDEGIWYFFEHTDKKHILVLADNADTHEECPGFSEARYAEDETVSKDDNLVESVTLEEQLIPNEYAAENYHFETPETDLLTSYDATQSGKLRIYDYPVDFTETAVGDEIVKRRIQAHEVTAKVLHGKGYCRAFTSGFKFTFAGHDRPDINDEYVIRSLFIHANQTKYTNSFVAFPASVPFRPLRLTRRPKIYGTQTALVVGKDGEEIWPDKYGRVLVQFYWDQKGEKDEKSSCWIRVAQMWANKGWGAMYIPHIGSEVVVSFLEGNPDKPLIIGSVYNATQVVPYDLPAEKTKSTIKTWSAEDGKDPNEIRFEDKADEQELYLHAQKDHTILVENDRKLDVIGKEDVTIKMDRTTTIQEGNESLTIDKGNRTIKISKGNETYSVTKGTRDLTVKDAETHTNKAGFTHEVAKDYELTVKGNLKIDVTGNITIDAGKKITITAGTEITNEAGTTLTNTAGTDLTNEASMNLVNDAGMDLTNKGGMNLTNKAGMDLTNKGGMNVTNDAGLQQVNKGTMVEVKGSAMTKVDGGGMLELKGGLVMEG
ncbi:MAG: type VI secretion system tip protein VgrG [Desulfobacterales bacterium]|nr:type VI secretion system tip protein VgrG [Desulfobacterales bacterium]